MPATPDSSGHETILAFDFGLRRIGVAVGQTVTGSASPLGVVSNGMEGPDWNRIEQLIKEWGAARLVVSDISALAEKFVAELDRFSLPVATIDERYSSAEAEQALIAARKHGTRGRISREAIDAAAASLIAERWLRNER